MKQLRVALNFTQKQLGEATGLSERGIQNYELGLRKPEYDAIVALADYFGVSIDYLVGRTDDPAAVRYAEMAL
ncbi:MAG: helix-turn-helix domain-containing protein [Firmicutes bacterium]|nr:helix-turn-helix domain-containing protein [Bacillota bacterium]